MFLIIAGLGLLGIFLFTAAFRSAPEEVKQIGQEASASPVGDSKSAADVPEEHAPRMDGCMDECLWVDHHGRLT